jgi:hypothetical protein
MLTAYLSIDDDVFDLGRSPFKIFIPVPTLLYNKSRVYY